MADVKFLKVNAAGDFSQAATGDTQAVAHGGTGATNAADARTNLDAQQQADVLDELAGLTLTKGDLLVHDGTNLNKLDAGSNGQVVSFNSATATGLEAVDLPTAVTEATVSGVTNDNASTINKGEPVYFKSDGDCDLAQANAETTCRSVGFVKDATIAAAADGEIQLDGVITLGSTGAWDTIAGTSGGLAPGTVYFLSAATPGRITSTPPSSAGSYVLPVLLGLSSTSGRILERPRVALT